jgi:hypothetical protein
MASLFFLFTISGLLTLTGFLTYLLTHSLTELSPSWEATNCAVTQGLPSILWNLKVHYRVHKSPLLVPILNHINLIHTIPSYLTKIHFNINHPPTERHATPTCLYANQYTRCSAMSDFTPTRPPTPITIQGALSWAILGKSRVSSGAYLHDLHTPTRHAHSYANRTGHSGQIQRWRSGAC